MPRPVLRAKGLSFRAKCIYNLLLDYAWQCGSCFPGQDRLADDLDTSVDTIQRGLKELKEYRLIDCKQAGLNRPNTYYILKLSDCCFLHPDTNLNGKPQTCGIQKPHDCGILTPRRSGTKNTKSKNTQLKNTKSFRKAHALKPKKEENGQTSTHSHIAPTTTRKRKAEAETREQKGRGVTFSPNKGGTTNKQDVQGRDQQVTPTSMIPKSVQENTERGINGHPSTTKQTPTQKRFAKIEASKHRQPAYIGKPLTQEEIDEKKKQGRNASGFTPLTGIIPASHWQELEARAATNGNGNGNLHYHHTTKNAPLSIDASIEQLSALLHDEPANTAQNINRAAKLCKQVGYNPDQFANLLWSIYHQLEKKPDKLFKTRRADGRPNKMLVFFTELEKALGVKPKPTN